MQTYEGQVGGVTRRGDFETAHVAFKAPDIICAHIIAEHLAEGFVGLFDPFVKQLDSVGI